MLSILIPVYNYNIVTLVNTLHHQAKKVEVPFEIIVLDDCSSELLRDQNMEVSKLPNVRFLELEKNIGRSRIRNRLAEMAVYPNLLFLDCDSEITSDRYIANYLPFCDQQLVVCGGRVYHTEPPDESEYLLRWHYGISREQVPAHIRNLNPYRSFTTNNFLIPKSVLLQVRFDESIIRYGHEDTLFGIELKKSNIPVKHIDNQTIHTGLEISREFLQKTADAIENLVTLLHDGKINREDIPDIRLLRAYEKVCKFHLDGIYLFFYNFISNTVMHNLLGSNPGIFAFDLYKLALIAQLTRKYEGRN